MYGKQVDTMHSYAQEVMSSIPDLKCYYFTHDFTYCKRADLSATAKFFA